MIVRWRRTPRPLSKARSSYTQASVTVSNNMDQNHLKDNEALIGAQDQTDKDTTGFVDTGSVVNYSGNEQNYTSPFAAGMADSDSKSIEDILSRYHQFGVYNQEMPYKRSVADIINAMPTRDKLRGFVGFSGVINFKLTWNTDPTIQGMFVLAYTPPGVTYPMLSDKRGLATFLTGCQHVICNLAESTGAVLSVPYVGEYNVIPLFSEPDSRSVLGNLWVTPIVATTSAIAPNAVQMSMYMNIEQLRTYGAQPRPVTVQASAAFGSLAESVKKSRIVSKTGGSIASWLNRNEDPSFLGSITRGLGWAVGGAAKIADLLGWSKPYDVQAMQTHQQMAYRDICGADVTFSAAKFTQNVDQGVGDVDLSGRSVDEMAIAEVLSRPNFFPGLSNTQSDDYPGIMVASTTMPEGTLIGRVVVGPKWFRYTIAPYTDGIQTQMSYMSMHFGFWRGSVRLVMRPVCTKFHSCRIRMVFVPGQFGSTNSDDVYSNMPYTYTKVVDVRDAGSFVIDVPYVCWHPWLTTGHDNDTSLDNVVGSVLFFIDNPLVAPANVSSQIQIPIFVCAGPDFEFASPGNYAKFDPWTVGTAIPVQGDPRIAGLVQPSHHEVVVVDLAPNITTNSNDAHAAAVGDPVRSLRAVLKRFWTSGTYAGGTDLKFVLSCEPSCLNVNEAGTDLISRLVWLYAFHRGGMRWFAQNYYPARATSIVSRTSDFISTSGVAQLTSSATLTGQTVGVATTEPTKFEVPYYNGTACVNHWVRGNEARAGLLIDYYVGSTSISFQRALADDASFGSLVGAPLVIVPASH